MEEELQLARRVIVLQDKVNQLAEENKQLKEAQVGTGSQLYHAIISYVQKRGRYPGLIQLPLEVRMGVSDEQFATVKSVVRRDRMAMKRSLETDGEDMFIAAFDNPAVFAGCMIAKAENPEEAVDVINKTIPVEIRVRRVYKKMGTALENVHAALRDQGTWTQGEWFYLDANEAQCRIDSIMKTASLQHLKDAFASG